MKIGGVTITSGAGAFTDRTNWTGTQIRGSEKGAVIGSWLGAILPLIVAAIFFWMSKMPLMVAKKFPNPVLAIFGLVSLCLLIKAIWETVRLNRFGDPVLELGAAPIPLGGTVEGRISISKGADKAPEFTVTLACIHQYQVNDGKNSHTAEKVLWSEDKKTSLLLGGILPVSMTVPSDQPTTNGTNPFDRILWRVTVKAPFRGQAFWEKYEVPVGQAPNTNF